MVQRFAISTLLWALAGSCLAHSAAAQAAPQGDLLKDVQQKSLLKVCIWPEYFGISYRNPRTGVFQGVDIHMSAAFAKDLGVALEYVLTDFSHLLDDLEARKCHIAMMAVGVTPVRAQRIDFSIPYLRSDVYAIATRSNRTVQTWEDIDQPGRVVVVQKGTYMEPLMRKILKKATLQVVLRPSERERDVESGRADVFITDYPYSKRMLKNTDWARVIAPPREIQLTDYAYAVPQGDPAWLERVNQFIRQVQNDGRLSQAAARYDLLPIVVKD
ncbi:MAG: ABC transporter substrate-binding protein [Burkholderiaceae bacterium]|nr:ABC transporter substrate-binding protein [Burkholderiaceae bacterium]